MNGLSRVAHVGVDHVEVALVDRHVDRLADRPAAVVEVGRQVGRASRGCGSPRSCRSAGRGRGRARTASRSSGRRPCACPPISTLLASLRAYWVNWRGAVAWTIWRHIPRGKRTRSPSTSAPASREQPERVGVAAELDADLLEDRVGVVLDDREALLAEDLERREGPGQERHPLDLGAEPGGAPAVASTGAAGRQRRRSSVVSRAARRPAWPSRVGVAGAAVGRVRAAARAVARPRRQRHDPLQVRARRRSGAGSPSPRRSAPGSAARPRSRSSRRGARRPRSRAAPRPTAARSARRSRRRCRPPGTRRGRSPGRARGPSRGAGRSGCRRRRRGGPRRPSRRPSWSMSSRTPGVQRGLGQLDRAHVVLGDRGCAGRRRRLVEDVAERPAVRRRRAACARRARRRSTPSAVMTPARNSSATTSMMPEPQMPVTPGAGGLERVGEPGSSDQASTPMTRKRGSSVVAVDPHALDGARARRAGRR